jgi:probable phosphoglycerate mutase
MFKKMFIFFLAFFPLFLFPTETTFLCIRHGQTHWNIENKASGHADIPLTETGILQAKETSKKLLARYPGISAIYSSDLQRARNTAEETAKIFNLPVVTMEAFREFRMGAIEGMLLSEIEQKYGTVKDFIEQYPNKEERWKVARFPGSESVYDQIDRVTKALITLAKKHPEEQIAVFAHGGILQALFAWIEEKDIGVCRFSNCDILLIGYDPEQTDHPFRIIEIDRRD